MAFPYTIPNLKRKKTTSPAMNVIHSTRSSNAFLNPVVNIGMHNEVDDFLSSDLEMSFASTLSISSPSTSPKTLLSVNAVHSPVPMDISPAPIAPSSKVYQSRAKAVSRPRALTTVRTFGRELANQPVAQLTPGSLKSETSTQSSKRLQRSALPVEWMSSRMQSDVRGQGCEMPTSYVTSSANHDAMDVDMDSVTVPLLDSSPMPKTAIQTDFANLFFDHASPVRHSIHLPKKRRSVSPERVSYEESPQATSSSPAPPSPSQRKFERFHSTGMGAGGLMRKSSKSSLSGLSHGSLVASKRLRRPTISAIVKSENIPPNGVHSAFPIMESNQSSFENESAPPMPRRALSAMVPPTNFGSFLSGVEDTSSDDISTNLDDMSSPAAQAYAKRQSMKTIRRRDGTEDFRPLTGGTALVDQEIKPRSSAYSASPSKFLGAGLPSFGDNEAHGKILPCHRVKEDGLMRINSQTLNSLLNGDYDSHIAGYHIIDCRFDYEYNGGHIRNAININTASDIEDFLFNICQSKPLPSCSGDLTKKTILIFHCEFSVKRAPTFAKHLRSKDRAMNNHIYPKIHYPELYILYGGYSQFYKELSVYCEPCGYVTMDDPAYISDRREDLGQFRKARFGRTKSYAYGDAAAKALSKPGQPSQLGKPQRNTAPSGGITSLFNAAAAARGRRGTSGLSTLDEVGNTSVEDECDGPLGDSPCPPASKNSALRAGLMSRAPLSRAFTLGCTDM